MTNEQILKKAIEKAVKNGLEFEYDCECKFPDICDWHESAIDYRIIFSHDFAKEFWGEKEWLNGMSAWANHLQQMVLEEQPLKYIEKFLK